MGRYLLLVWLGALSAVGQSYAQVPTVSLQAVQVNARITNPSSIVDANRGDIIVAEIFLRNWSPEGQALRAYQVAIDLSGSTSGDTGSVRPLGSEHKCPPEPCSSDGDCDTGMTCLADGCCYGPDYLPGQGAFIIENRPDYVFHQKSTFGVVDLFNYKYVRSLANTFDCVVYQGTPKYLGTLILEVSDDASGTFTIPILSMLDSQLLECDDEVTRITPLATESLVVNVPELNRQLVQSDPPSCSIDARQPTDPNRTTVLTPDTIALRFDPPATEDLTVDDFDVRQEPAGPDAIAVLSLDPDESAPGWAILTISQKLSEGRWTCITYLSDPPGEICVAPLPADVDGNGVSDASDLIMLNDHLNGMLEPPLAPSQCDVDRSGSCGPADLLRAIDLLGGAVAFDTWLGATLPTCPTTP